MIPYDDLVAALSAWRARQGLPVSTMGGGAPSPGSGPHAQPGSGPYGQPGSGPNRGAPPAPPRGNKPSVPPPLAASDDMHEVDDAEMLDEQYENEGQDFAMQFGGDVESTAIGNAPERPTDPSDFQRGRGGRGGDDW
jgi:hypothetical protein